VTSNKDDLDNESAMSDGSSEYEQATQMCKKDGQEDVH